MPQALAEEFKTIPMSPNLGQSLERAHAAAREQRHRFVLLEHLLFALTEDPEASLILQSANVDPAGLGADVATYLTGLGDEVRSNDGGEARPDTELLRVLQAAASAAQQSKRRQIDGAIVLAAIVGDGKSPAAGLLKRHGMTFEEAIRALQRANTKARLKPIAKAPGAAQAPAPAAAPSMAPQQPAPREPEPPAEPQRAAEPPAPAPEYEPDAAEVASQQAHPSLDDIVEDLVPQQSARSGPPVQSADEILAAARARIQRRAAVLSQAPDAPYFSAPPAKEIAPEDLIERRAPAPSAGPQTKAEEPEPPAPGERSRTDAVSDAMRELLVSTGADARNTPPPPSDLRDSLSGAAAALPRETVVPIRPGLGVPDPAPIAPAHPQSAPTAPGPFMQAAMAAAARPAVAPGVPPPGMDVRGPMPPWPGPAAPTQPSPMAPPGKSRAGAAMDRRQLTRATAPLPAPPAAQRKAPGGERGPLVEAIPRRMRLGFSTEGEVRIAQERIDQLVQALSGRSAGHTLGDPVVMRALTVRLRTQDGGFFIEPLTPETQWVEANPHGVHVEPLTWRWAITPRQAGKGKLVLLVSMRSIDLDGASEEVGPPDRIVEIKVRGTFVRTLLRRVMWVVLLGAVYAIGRWGTDVGPLLWRTIRQVTGL